MPIRPALFAAILAASPAAADMIEVTIANAPAGAQLCALVMQAPGEASAARAMIEAQRPVFAGGMASIEPPRDTTGRALYFEGRVRLVATAPGHCPVGCDLDIFWSHPPDPGTALAEQACAFDLSLARTGSTACREGETTRLPYATGPEYRPAPGEAPIPIAGIDGEVEYHIGDTSSRPLTCATP